MGSFHPHGDQAIYDALVRLAQDFASRYPLIDGQGNFGNIDGDGAAAYRYTEARMTEVARLLLEGIDEDAVDFRPNYDGTSRGAGRPAGRLPEPARQRLAGHRGRHGDVDPAAQRGRVVRRRAAPDHAPQGELRQLLAIRAGAGFPDRRHRRRHARGDRRELPHRARLVPGAGALAQGGYRAAAPGRWSSPRFPTACRSRASSRRWRSCCKSGSCRFSPTSATNPPRTCASCWSRARAASIRRSSWNRLFRLTELESRVPLNMNVLSGGKVPRVLGLAEALREWIDHRRDVLHPPLAPPPRRHRAAPGDPARPPYHLSRPRPRHQDHPREGRAEGGADARLQAHRAAGQCHPRHAPALPAQARGDGAEARARRPHDGEGRDRGPARLGSRAMEGGGRPDPRSPQDVRTGHGARPTPRHLRRGARHLGHRFRRGHGRARADHRRGLAEGLDPRPQGARARSRRRRLQGRRRAQDGVLHRDDRQGPGLRRQRALLHPRRVEAAGRARLWRPDPSPDRS